MINIFAQILAGGIIICYCIISKRHHVSHVAHSSSQVISKNHENSKSEQYYKICFFLLILIYIVILFYKVEEFPPRYHIDEAGAAYDALSLVHYGTDRYLYKYPVILTNFGGHGQDAFYCYLAALSIKIFGYSILSLRLPVMLFAIVSAFCFAILVRKEFGKTASLILLGLFCILPYSIMTSRWGLQSFFLFRMMNIACLTLYTAMKTGKIRFFILTGFLLGLALYTYAISYIFIPVFLLLFIATLLFTKQITCKKIFLTGIPLFVIAIPLLLMLAVNFGLIDEIKTPYFSIPKIIDFQGGDLKPEYIINNIQFNKSNIFYRTLVEDFSSYNSHKKFGTLYYFSIPFMLLGCFLSIKNALFSIRTKSFSLDFLITCIFFASFLTSINLVEINVHRTNELFLPLIYFICRGIYHLAQNSKKIIGIICAIYGLLFILFIHFYFTDYTNVIDKELGLYSDYKNALMFTESINKQKKPVNVISYYGAYIQTLVALEMDPYEFAEKRIMDERSEIIGLGEYRFMTYIDWDNYPNNSIYIFRNPKQIPWKIDLIDGFNTEKFGRITVYYPSEYSF